MEQADGRGLRESNHSNDLLTLLNPFISQVDFQPGSSLNAIATNPQNLVVTANIENSIAISETQPEVEESFDQRYQHTEKNCLDSECSCATQGSCKTSEDVCTTVEEIATIDNFNPEIIESSFSPSADVPTPENSSALLTNNSEFLSHNNICKTIKEITNNQKSLISDIEMPQNSLLEEAITMSNIVPTTVSSSGSEFIPMHDGVGLQQSQNRYPVQNWSVDNGSAVSGNCEVSAFANSRPNYVPSNVNPAVLSQYSDANMDSGYIRGVLPNAGYQSQQQFVEHNDRNAIGNQLSQMLHSSQLPIQDYQAHMRTDTLPVASAAQDPSISFDKMNAYNQPTLYNTNPGQLPHPQASNLQTTMSFPNAYHLNNEEHFSKVSHIHAPSKTRSDSGGEELEDRSGEKKLTTTPIPSDAEKMSSSGSVSSGSIEESPSPGDLDSEQRLNKSKLRNSPLSGGDISGDYANYGNLAHHNIHNFQDLLNGSALDGQFNNPDILSNENALSSIPDPENVVEIDEGSFDYHNVVIANDATNLNASSSSLPSVGQVNSLNNSTAGQSFSRNNPSVSTTTTTNSGVSKTHSATDGSSSWSVMKEERRKRKMEKKLKAKQLSAQGLATDIRDKGDASSFGSNKKRHHKHKHRSKHHHKEDSLSPSKRASNQERLSTTTTDQSGNKSYSSGTSYSGLIPKVTADPTNNSNLSAPKSSSGPIKSITERVRQQMEEEKSRKSGKHKSFTSLTPVINQIPKIAAHNESSQPSLQKANSSNVAKPVGSSTIVPSKLGPVNKETEPKTPGVSRWQTVTAVTGPKLPPVLSERDRIPKRGRPSKKMSELNLKYKGDSDPNEVSSKSQPPEASVPPAAPTEGSSVVAMYTIGASGFQELDNKPKQNQRSKDRAAAFRNYLSEISRTSSIQNKTAGAKDAVGAFAVGVRTRKQASSTNNSEGDRKKKKPKSKRAVFGGDSANPAKPAAKNETNVKCLDDSGMYTFSELAKHFKISNSIVYRAMEQSKRIGISKRKSHKHKSSRSSFVPVSPQTTNDSATHQTTSVEKITKLSKPTTEDKNAGKEKEEQESVVPEMVPIKPISLSSEKSVDLVSSDKVKRKKKKKHKKEKGDLSKKKKRKDKKKKSKQKQKLSKESSDSVFSPESNNDPSNENLTEARLPSSKSSEVAIPSPTAQVPLKPKNKPDHSVVYKKPPHSEELTVPKAASRTKQSRTGSTSSLSGNEDVYDGEDSSSDICTCSQDTTASFGKIVSKSGSNSTTCTSTSSSVFGSGIISVMPSFQGIKEHGGLIQFSEHSKDSLEGGVLKAKKHKHKKKKLLGRSKNASDPEFLSKMESVVESLENMRLSPTMGFLNSPFTRKSLNVFATSFHSKPSSFRSSFERDAFSYRDPARNQTRQKNQNVFSFSNLPSTGQPSCSKNPATSSLYANMSTFCQSEFFKTHGFIKPFSEHTATNALTTPIQPSLSNAQEKFTSIKDMPPKPLFSQSPSFSLLQSNQSVPANTISSTQYQSKPDDQNQRIENAQPQRPAKRKRGWPRGKPRGPRCKKPSLDLDISSSLSEKPSTDGRQSNEKQDDSKKTENPSKTFSSVSHKKVGCVKSKETVTPSRNTTRNSPVASSASMVRKSSCDENEVPSTSSASADVSEKSTKVAINHEFVDHIKAAIAERLTNSNVCSDTVAKTVDSAVASFFQGIGANESSKPTPSSQPSNHRFTSDEPKSPGLSKKVKRRGRPPKHPRPVQTTKANTASDKDKQSSEKHPKKLWASMHQVYSKTSENSDGKPKKRGPGRPRKYAIDPKLLSEPAKPASSLNSVNPLASTSSEAFSCQRASALYAPSARLIKKHLSSTFSSTRLPKNKRGRKPKALKAVSKVSKSNTESALSKFDPSTSKSVISNHKAKVAAGAVLSCKVLEHEAQSTPLSVSVDTEPDPGDVVDSSQETQSKVHYDGEVADTKSRSSSESSQKSACPKKSLESVVAKLKSKQSNVSITMTGNSNDNNNTSTTLQELIGTPSFAGVPSKISKDDGAKVTTEPGLYVKRKRSRSTDSAESCPPMKKAGFSSSVGKPETALSEKNNYLHAGLFSSEFKIDRACEETVEVSDSTVSFPLPKHAGLFLRKSRRDFQLPHHVWWGFHREQIQTKQNVSTKFTAIDENIYVDTHSTVEADKHVCGCPPDASLDAPGCGKECLNRLMYIECSSDTCPSGERCSNRSIQNKQLWKDTELFKTTNKGWGLRTTTDIPEGQFILEYLGEVVSESRFRRRLIENYSFHSNRYCAQLEAGKIIDAYRVGNKGRFVNHSCRPNCEMQRWVSEGEYHLCLFAKQAIKAGTELTFDYSSHDFDMDTSQPCRCGSSSCRGVIGGKTRVYPESSLNRISKAFNASGTKKKTNADRKDGCQLQYTTINENSMQPTSMEEKAFIKRRKPFLFRNLVRIKRQHERAKLLASKDLSSVQRSRNRKDAGKDVEKQILLYEAINDIFSLIMTCKDESGVSVALPFINLRSKQQHDKDPVDLSFVQDQIMTKQYENLEEFSLDLLHAFRNAEKYFGRKSSLGKGVARLRRVFTSARNNAAALLGETTEKHKNKVLDNEAEIEDRRKNGDYIRCICGLHRDEGTMIQCEKCYVWQHCDCMKVKPSDYNDSTEYLCEECDGRDVPREVEVTPQPFSAPPGHTYFLTLLKDNLLVKQGDCVRIIHDHCLRQRTSSHPPVRTSYRLQSHSTPDRMDFFRIKKLWTDDNGDKFAYGCHFVRPQDTKHTEGRMFFTNELFATPFHEIVPLDAVVSLCCVMDLETYRTGKPKDFKPPDIYICQHRVDLSLRIVNKVIKNRFPVCTKGHVFDSYPVKIVTVRDHQVQEQYRKTQSRRTQWLKAIDRGTKSSDEEESSDNDETERSQTPVDDVAMETVAVESDDPVSSGNEKNVKQRRLNGILSKLLKDANKKKNDQLSENKAAS